MTVEKTITLRDAGRRLAPLRHSLDKVASDELLDLLKSGEITAVFRFPGPSISWIKIPAIYWIPFSSERFRIIRRSNKKKNSGILTVQLGDFAEDIVNQLNAQLENKKTVALDEWKALLQATTNVYEVEITESAWTEYLDRNNLTEPGPETKSTSGRNQKKGWRKLSVIIGAYIIKHYAASKEEIKIDEASKKIHAIAKDSKIFDLPSASTIKDELAAIKTRAETLSIK